MSQSYSSAASLLKDFEALDVWSLMRVQNWTAGLLKPSEVPSEFGSLVHLKQGLPLDGQLWNFQRHMCHLEIDLLHS